MPPTRPGAKLKGHRFTTGKLKLVSSAAGRCRVENGRV